MPGHAPPDRSPQRQFPRRILAYPAPVALGTLMSVAVVVLERRIRKALRSSAEPDRRTSQVGAGV